MADTVFRSGFVSIVGKPNVGKSTLLNRLVGERLSIITPKAQTTRHRILGILQGSNYQIVFSDTPGIIKPSYALHEIMMQYVHSSVEDADVILLMVTPDEASDETVMAQLKKRKGPLLIVINKSDLLQPVQVEEKIRYWRQSCPDAREVIAISAVTGYNCDVLLETILKYLPEHPPYFGSDELTDKSERFLAAEILREKIFLHLSQEVPYSTEVVVTQFKEEGDLLRISAEIYVERASQKAIIIGKNGTMLKKLGTAARQDMEAFFGKKVFLETHVKVAENWRKQKDKLKRFGYLED
ncbi:MAG: GTPase Era [Cyclobacteriaceae bacterium]|nr:GTPase Era [Cyclobacteriaceae bacterium]